MRKKVLLIVAILLVGALAFGISRMAQNPEKYQKQEESVSTVLDCAQFSRISTEDLFAKLGEPTRTEDWTNETTKGDFAMKIYTFPFEGFSGEFITYEDTVVKLRLFADAPWQVEGKSDNIFAMFGIVPGDSAKKTVDTGATHKFSPVNDKIAEVEFFNFNEEDKTFDTVYVTYNLNYFD